MPVKIRHGQALELLEHDLADIDDHALANVGYQIGLAIVENASDEEGYDNACRNDIQHEHILFRQHLVHHVLDDPRQVKIGSCRHDDAENSQDKTPCIRPHILQQPLVILHG